MARAILTSILSLVSLPFFMAYVRNAPDEAVNRLGHRHSPSAYAGVPASPHLLAAGQRRLHGTHNYDLGGVRMENWFSGTLSEDLVSVDVTAAVLRMECDEHEIRVEALPVDPIAAPWPAQHPSLWREGTIIVGDDRWACASESSRARLTDGAAVDAIAPTLPFYREVTRVVNAAPQSSATELFIFRTADVPLQRVIEDFRFRSSTARERASGSSVQLEEGGNAGLRDVASHLPLHGAVRAPSSPSPNLTPSPPPGVNILSTSSNGLAQHLQQDTTSPVPPPAYGARGLDIITLSHTLSVPAKVIRVPNLKKDVKVYAPSGRATATKYTTDGVSIGFSASTTISGSFDCEYFSCSLHSLSIRIVVKPSASAKADIAVTSSNPAHQEMPLYEYKFP